MVLMFTPSTDEAPTHPPTRLRRRGAVLRSADRGRLERAGWRTTLDFRENHVRSDCGRLLRVQSMWVAEAELVAETGVDGVCASARSESRAWAKVVAVALAEDSSGTSRTHELEVRDLRPIS